MPIKDKLVLGSRTIVVGLSSLQHLCASLDISASASMLRSIAGLLLLAIHPLFCGGADVLHPP